MILKDSDSAFFCFSSLASVISFFVLVKSSCGMFVVSFVLLMGLLEEMLVDVIPSLTALVNETLLGCASVVVEFRESFIKKCSVVWSLYLSLAWAIS